MKAVYSSIGYFLAVAALLLLSRQLNGDWYWWQSEIIRLLSVFAIVTVVAKFPRSYLKFVRWGLLVFAVGLSLTTVYLGLSQLVGGLSYERVRLFLPNANILGATLVITFIAVSVFYRHLWVLYLLCLTLLAVLLTGSRAALITLLLSSLLWLFLSQGNPKQKRAGIAVISLILIASVAAVWYLASNKLEEDRNLLRASGNFSEVYWKKQHAQSIQVLASTVPSPLNNALADQLVARSGERKVLLLQLAEVSKPDKNYVGSIYLRAEQAQEIVLFALGRVTCQVTTQWQRCVTPPTPGNGRSRAQLRLETPNPNQEVDIYIWGAQLEYDAVSDLALQDPSLSNYVKRFAVSLWSEDSGLSLRRQVAQAAWKIFLSHPLAGVGEQEFSPTLKILAGDNKALARITHAHNLVLHTLATQGLIGFLALLLLLVATVIPVRKHWTKLLPMWVALFLLNMTDFTFYSGSVFYVYWATLGLLSAIDQE